MPVGLSAAYEVKPRTARGSWSIPITLNNIAAAGDVVTSMTPGFAGSIKRTTFVVTTVVTTGAKAATLNLEIGTVNLVGGTVALTSANCTPLGAVVAGAAVTGSNEFSKVDTISVEASSVTQFSEGVGVLIIEYETELRSGGDASTDNRYHAGNKRFHGSWCYSMTLANIANGDMITQFTPGFAGEIVRTRFVTTTVASTGGKGTTLNLEIGALNLVGGTVVLTTALCDTLGEVVDGAAIAGSNAFSDTNTISVEAASTTTFSEGAGVLMIEYEGDVLS